MSSKAEEFIESTDFATIKNRTFPITASLSLPAQVLSADQIVTVSQDVTVDPIGGNMRVNMASVKDGGLYYSCYVLILDRVGIVAGPTNAPYQVQGYIGVINPTTLRVSITVQNPYSEGLAMAFGTETILFEISTFLSPFS